MAKKKKIDEEVKAPEEIKKPEVEKPLAAAPKRDLKDALKNYKHILRKL